MKEELNELLKECNYEETKKTLENVKKEIENTRIFKLII